MLRSLRRTLGRTFNWDVVIRWALVPAIGYVMAGVLLGVIRGAPARSGAAVLGAAASLAAP
ncbi:MAG TPA: hypothetical protein VNM66_03585 [Thermodesulfobacteriota bacterium]|nr:hypothetical protein [Thermodesulfobacteriota bacterium]